MLVSLGKKVLRKTIEYQVRGLKSLRHGVIFFLGLSLASLILALSGHNPFLPETAYAISLSSIASSIASVFVDPRTLTDIFIAIIGGVLAGILGFIMTLVMYLAIALASYDVVINIPNVVTAWRVLRDVVNLFFVIILLIIAIGTTLRREQYMWNKNLPRFIIAAIFVNFSRTIVAFVTDFADVVQQTFVAGLGSVGFAKFTAGFGVTFFQQFTTNAVTISPSETSIASSVVISIILMFIVIAIMWVYMAMFLVRVVALWLIAIFSPVAFVCSILPQTQKYYKEWWNKLSQAAILGPLLAFFLWLAVTIVPDPSTASSTFSDVLTGAPQQFGAASQPNFIIGFCLMTIILYFGMQQGMGLAGDFGSFVGKAQSFAFGTFLGGVSGAAAFVGKDLFNRADYLQMRTRQAIGKGMQGSQNRFVSGLGRVVGAGGMVSNLRQAFRERAEEGQKRRSDKGLEANKALATTVGTWPVLKAVELIQRPQAVKGDIQEKAGGSFKAAMDIMQDSTTAIGDRQTKARDTIEEARTRAREALGRGDITQAEFNEIDQLANDHLGVVNHRDWRSTATAEGLQNDLRDRRSEREEVSGRITQARSEMADATNQVNYYNAQLAAPGTTPAQRAAFRRERTLAQNRFLTAQTAVTAGEARQNTLPTEIENLEARITALRPRVDRDATNAMTTTTVLRERSSDLTERGQRLSSGQWAGIGGRTLVNLGEEAGTQRRLQQREKWESDVKDVERQTDNDPKALVDYMVRAHAAGDADKVRAALMGLAKKDKLPEVMANFRAQPVMEALMREKLVAEAQAEARRTGTPVNMAGIDDFMDQFRRAPSNRAYMDTGLELLLKRMYNGNNDVVAKVLDNIREAAHEKGGASPTATMTDAVSGNTKLIEMKVQRGTGGAWEISYDTKALKALNAELKGMKPGEFMYNLKKANLFSTDADGNVVGIAPLYRDYIKALPAITERHVRNNMSRSLIQSIKENRRLLEDIVTRNPTSTEGINTQRLLDAMRQAREL